MQKLKCRVQNEIGAEILHFEFCILTLRKAGRYKLAPKTFGAGCTCLENRIGNRRGRSVTDAFRQNLTPNERKSYATCHPLPKPVALSQELQTKPNYPNPTGHEAELHFSSDATVRFEAAIGTRLVAQEQSARLISGRPRSVTARDDHPFACRLRLGRPISPGS